MESGNSIDKKQPIVVLRPSSNEVIGDDIYQVKQGLYLPTPEKVRDLVDFLNQFRMDAPSGIKLVDDKMAAVTTLRHVGTITLEDAERRAVDNHCNILGGAFLSFVNSYGMDVGQRAFPMDISAADIDFIQTLYPDIAGYFVAPDQLTEKQIKFAEGVILSNTGELKVIEIGDDVRIFSDEIMQKLTLLKSVFRHAAKMKIPYDLSKMRCNLIHSPETAAELEDHIRVINAKINGRT